jgi:N-dimethylarginine dimethylaminohydrolase
MDIKENLLSDKSAYHGGSWIQRSENHASECLNSDIWGHKFGYNCEYENLLDVLLLNINDNFPSTSNAEKIQFLEPIDLESLKKEYDHIELALKANNARVHKISTEDFPEPSPNLLFCRDLFFCTPYGAILGRMGSPVRSGEEKFAQLALAKLGIPILKTISGTGTFEGADAIWLNSDTILIGIGNRTNEEGFLQIQQAMSEFSIKCIRVYLPKNVQHLLGILQIVDSQTAFVRVEIASDSLLNTLNGYKIVSINETQEVVLRQALNFVTIGPKMVLMARDCPEMKSILQANGVKICAELSIKQLIRGAGGLACATGVLSRKLRFSAK